MKQKGSRCFLAITPDPETCLAIHAWRERSWHTLGRAVPAQNYHLTLAFLGNIDAQERQVLDEALDSLTIEPVRLQLDKTGYWSKNGILWLGSNKPSATVEALADDCRRAANKAGIRVSRKRFEPHLTLARNETLLPQAPLVEPDFTLQTSEILLYQSVFDNSGVRYLPLRAWH